MKSWLRGASLSAFLLMQQGVQAVLEIEITRGIEGALPVAVVTFSGETYVAPEAVETIVRDNLRRSGFFNVLEKRHFPQTVTEARQLDYQAWRDAGVESLLLGKIDTVGSDQYQIEFQLFDLIRQQRLLGNVIFAASKDVRRVGHRVSDVVFEELTGIRGAFSTRIAYISTLNKGTAEQKYVLQVADADGHNPSTVFVSDKQMMSPAWSPDGRRLAYVSFEGDSSAVYIQDIFQNTRLKVPTQKGINSSPAWSPDGRFLALTLSKDGNPDIYLMNLATWKTKRITNNSAIDTEPCWMPHGKSLLFTSDRGGSPQIYEVSVNGGEARRITLEGRYNAAAAVSPDGRFLAAVHRNGNGFRIAVTEMNNSTDSTMHVITKGRLDERPSYAPNGSMIIYATVEHGRGVLAAVSADGRVRQSIRLTEGDVREPVWSPFHQ